MQMNGPSPQRSLQLTNSIRRRRDGSQPRRLIQLHSNPVRLEMVAEWVRRRQLVPSVDDLPLLKEDVLTNLDGKTGLFLSARLQRVWMSHRACVTILMLWQYDLPYASSIVLLNLFTAWWKRVCLQRRINDLQSKLSCVCVTRTNASIPRPRRQCRSC